jgi:hypothetical protein
MMMQVLINMVQASQSAGGAFLSLNLRDATALVEKMASNQSWNEEHTCWWSLTPISNCQLRYKKRRNWQT